jgi:cytochrome b involved in lipid metabolism
MSRRLRVSGPALLALLVGVLTACAPLSPQTAPEEPNSASQSTESGAEVMPDNSASETTLRGDPEVEAEQEADEDRKTSSASKDGKPSASDNESPELESVSKISFKEVRANNSFEKCWIVLLGNVYNFTPVVQQHPFGAQLSNAVCGKDATDTFRENTDINDVVEQLSPLYLGPVG